MVAPRIAVKLMAIGLDWIGLDERLLKLTDDVFTRRHVGLSLSRGWYVATRLGTQPRRWDVDSFDY